MTHSDEDTAQQKGNGGRQPVEDLTVTEHTLDTDAGQLAYRATAGRFVIAEEVTEEGVFQGTKPKAEVFVTSYERTDTDPKTRPVIFAFNGGPGSSSAWLHLGLFGPRLADSGDVDNRVPPPYGIIDNPQTPLTHADLVFIDPMSTGYSRSVVGEKPDSYHGFAGDRDLVGETIRLWLTRNGRWLSPKFIAGESYGTTRAAALAGYLSTRHGLALNGVILISAILDFGTVYFTDGNDAPARNFVPTYAAYAHYHGKHEGRTLESVVEEAEQFAAGEYATALEHGHRMTEDERRAVAEKLAKLVGVSTDYVLQSDLRLRARHFFAELLRDRDLMAGRFDGRMVGHPGDLTLASQEVDPTRQLVGYPFTAAMNHYLGDELGYQNDLTYEITTDKVRPWSYAEFENRSVHTAENLAAAMRDNPYLKVYCAMGYYDGATPFAAAEHVLAHLKIPRDYYDDNIMTRYYPAGHMMYVHQPSRIAQSRHITEFVDWASGGTPPQDGLKHPSTAGPSL